MSSALENTQSQVAKVTWLCLGALLASLLFAASALAGPPNHARDEGRDLAGFDHACGTAVDSAGNVYVSSAGEDEIEVFDPSGTSIDSITNTNEPCGLAVDTDGTLYVSERETGEVVRYEPPTYATREVVDASGDAEGIAVDPFDDRLYVAKGNVVDAYNSGGTLGENERQRIRMAIATTGGTFTVSFEGSLPSPPINFDPGADPVVAAGALKSALEGLSTIGPGDVLVEFVSGTDPDRGYHVEFTGALGGQNVGPVAADCSGLIDGGCTVIQGIEGWDGHIAEGELSEATGVAAYTHRIQSDKRTRYLSIADGDGDEVKIFSGTDFRDLKHRRTITGIDEDKDGEVSTEEEFEFGSAGTALAADPGNREGEGCPYGKPGEQACTAGHLLLYDDGRESVVELDATGEFLDEIVDPDLADAEPTGMAIDRSGGANDGTIYLGSGAGPGARVLAFAPLTTPGRSPLPELSRTLAGAAAVATDRFDNVYVAAGPFVHIFGPDGEEVTKFEDSRVPFDLAVDSECNVYVIDGPGADRQMTYYSASACLPTPDTTYSRHTPSIVPSQVVGLEGIAVNPANDHPLVLWTEHSKVISEFESAADGSGLLGECGAGLGLSNFRIDIDVYGKTGTVFISENPQRIHAIDCGDPSTTADDEVVTQFRGAGCPDGQFGASPAIAVDQSNGHVVEFAPGQAGDNAREYEASGTCVARFGQFSEPAGAPPYSVAIDTRGVAYVAYDSNDNVAQPFDLSAFAALSYGDVPEVAVSAPSGLGDAEATLNGTVNPEGFLLEECRFEYLTDAQRTQNEEESKPPFEGATPAPCVPAPGDIGPVDEAVAVHADVSGLDPEVRYRFRLVAENQYGPDTDAGLFGPPLLTPKPALPVFYAEATLRGEVDPSGLATTYRFQYATDAYFDANGETYEHATPAIELPPGEEGAVAVKGALTGLAEGTEYHFRLVAENEALSPVGPDQTFRTRKRTVLRDCPNSPYRIGLSAKLPDCRAYELTTPPNTGGAQLRGLDLGGRKRLFNGYLAAPRGPEAGESVGFFSGTLPGLEGSGETDGYRSTRATGEHPKAGWSTELYGPNYEQYGASPGLQQEGVGPDQRYWFWDVSPIEAFANTLAAGLNLRTPPGVANSDCAGGVPNPQPEFELVGCGGEGADPDAFGLFLGNGNGRLVFSSEDRLEPTAPPAATTALYARTAGEASAEVLSLPPSGASPGVEAQFETADARYLAASESGDAVAFEVAGTLYLRRGGETIAVSEGPHTFAGLSADGTRLFYTATTFGEVIPPPAQLFLCDVEAGPCVGGGEAGLTEIAADAVFVNVAAGGEDVLFTSEEDLTGAEANDNGEEAQANEPNLYHWEDGTVRFVAILDPDDLVPSAFGELFNQHLLSWTAAAAGRIGAASTPTRSSPGGEAFLLLSHGQLTAYDNGGIGQAYRYAPTAPTGSRLLCVSCDPTGAPPTGEALLQDFFGGTTPTTLVLNLTDDGAMVFFESPDRIVPEDANAVTDVYQWRALGEGEGTEECADPAGCLALISSGQGEDASHIFGMSADGADVFFRTTEKLVSADALGSFSIYDARVLGGIPDPPAAEDCQGDACQPLGSPPPNLPAPASSAAVPDGDVAPQKSRKCGKGKHKVKRKGKVRCVKKASAKKKKKKGKSSKRAKKGAGR